MMQMQRVVPFLAAMVAMVSPFAQANDSVAELGTGGLVLGRSDVIRMAKENLRISMDSVDVDYIFRNESDQSVETLVAFPMPDITFHPDEMTAIPQPDNDGDLFGFSVSVSGEPVAATLQQRVMSRGVDITDRFLAAGLKPNPYSEAGRAALDALSGPALDDMVRLGAVVTYEGDAGQGMQTMKDASWTLASAYYWTAQFAPHADVAVHHHYVPSVGGTAGVYFADKEADPAFVAKMRTDYCMDDSFIDAVRRRVATQGENGPYFTEARIRYILTTGANWNGSIGDFTLTIDKGSTDNLVSFCGEGVTKTGPTTFEMHATDFWPERDLDILFVVRAGE